MNTALPKISGQMAGEYQIRYKTAFVLRTMREKKGVSQQRMANDAGIYPQSYHKYEKALHTPSLHLLFSFAKTLGVQPSEIVKRIEQIEI